MTKDVFGKCLQIIKENKIDIVDLIGGEPTIHANFFYFLDRLSKLGVKISLISNGRMFRDIAFLQKTINSGVSRISMSFQVSNPEDAESLLGSKEAYSDMLQAINNLKKFRNKIEFGLHVVLGKNDIDFYKKVFLKIRELGFSRCSIGPNNSSITNCGTIAHDDLSTFILKLRPFLRKIGLKVKFLSKMPLCLFPARLLKKMLDNKEINSCCAAYHKFYMHIDPDGSLLPCTYWIRTPMGNIDEFFTNNIFSKEKFNKKWIKGHFSEFRKKAFAYRSKKCKECKLFPKKCLGGCMLSYRNKDKKHIDRMIVGWKGGDIFYAGK